MKKIISLLLVTALFVMTGCHSNRGRAPYSSSKLTTTHVHHDA